MLELEDIKQAISALCGTFYPLPSSTRKELTFVAYTGNSFKKKWNLIAKYVVRNDTNLQTVGEYLTKDINKILNVKVFIVISTLSGGINGMDTNSLHSFQT
jgi:hypothetical protein